VFVIIENDRISSCVYYEKAVIHGSDFMNKFKWMLSYYYQYNDLNWIG